MQSPGKIRRTANYLLREHLPRVESLSTEGELRAYKLLRGAIEGLLWSIGDDPIDENLRSVIDDAAQRSVADTN